MSTVVESPRFGFIPEEIRFGVERAAAYEGRAQAMIVNLQSCLSDKSKMNIWEAEQEVWSQRKTEFLSAAPLQREQLSDYAAKIVSDSFTMNILLQ